MTELLDLLRARRDAGSKLLVPYLMGGIPDRDSFRAAFEAVAKHADVVELGLPFSDPLMDGPVIAAAGERAIHDGIGPLEVLELAAGGPGAPFVAMTYYNPIHACGEEAFCDRLVTAGAQGLIVPDLPLEESAGVRRAAVERGLAWIPLVAPTSTADRVREIVATATGFVYAVSTLGVTGTREALSERARKVVEVCRSQTDLPVLVGIGVSNESQAVEACSYADGVVIGSAVVRLVLEEGGDAAEEFLSRIRSAIGPSAM
jgi:tryptophan synthase alpha chain